MNTKILVSLLVIGLTAIAIGGGMTGAFFSDTETSKGNTFTAGAIDLKVDNNCSYNGVECKLASDDKYHWNGDVNEDECFCTWNEIDLEDGHLFFNFSDLKPGDWGEDTISLHVHNNSAWACAAIIITKNDDVSCTEPENETVGGENGNCSEPDANYFDGDLAQNLSFFFWVDKCNDTNQYPNAYPGDNIYQPGCDEFLMAGPASNIIEEPNHTAVYTLADNTTNNVGGVDGQPLEGCHTYYIGKAWCFGTMNVNQSTGVITCDGASVDNKPQTDEVQGDIIFYAVQARNNPNFNCHSVNWP